MSPKPATAKMTNPTSYNTKLFYTLDWVHTLGNAAVLLSRSSWALNDDPGTWFVSRDASRNSPQTVAMRNDGCSRFTVT